MAGKGVSVAVSVGTSVTLGVGGIVGVVLVVLETVFVSVGEIVGIWVALLHAVSKINIQKEMKFFDK